jgi:phenylpyruvate tautomerase PptA (4-oxalocrotonate tautomerase family)
MPYVKIETNRTLDKDKKRDFIGRASAGIAHALSKPEQWIMISLYDGAAMMFNGTEAPAAYVELKSIGLQEDSCARLSGALCDLLGRELDIPPERVYIEFHDINGKMFGWNKKTF